MVKKRKQKKRVRNSLTDRKDNGGSVIRTFKLGTERKTIFGMKSVGKGIFHHNEEGHLLALSYSGVSWFQLG